MLKELRSVLALSWGHFVIDVYSPVIPAVLPLLIATHGWSYAVAGLLVAGFNITSSFLQPFVGWLADRRGVAVPFPVPFLIASVCIGVFGFIGSYPVLLLCACLAAFGAALFHPSAMAMVNRLTRTENRGRLTSIFVIGGNLGFALGPVLAGLAVGAFGLQGLIFLAVPGLLMAGLFNFLLPAEETGPMKRTEEEAEAEGPVSFRPIAMVVGVGALRSWAIFAAVAFLPTYLHTALEVDLITANTLVSLMLVAGVVGQYVGGALSDTYGRKEYTFLGLAASVPPFVLFLTTGGLLSYAALLLFGFLLWSTFSVTVAMGQEVMPGRAGLASGLMLGLAVGAGGLGVIVSGVVADAFTLNTALATLLLPIIAAALLTLFVPYPWASFGRRVRSGAR
ncbi:MFS transporter [Methanofollis formosanus]|uniref:MFS transporter n=1 Tax=Methanofollis formosanus TaxID=299308 RepID=A0A8G1A240_9EURY|nr:MFS transporter [Methanofollis formosanus]QYZ79670.1 MFS transporter [Methanofollis formosanus]